jgi:hypothetical protein
MAICLIGNELHSRFLVLGLLLLGEEGSLLQSRPLFH